MDNERPGDGSAGTISSVASLLFPGESVVQIWKGYHPSHESTRTSIGTRVLRGERNVGAPEPALLVLTDQRILVLDLKGVFRRKYVLSESAPLENISQVEVIGTYRTDVRIKGEWGYYSFVEFNRPIRVNRTSLEESGNEDPLGAKELIMTGSQKAKVMAKK
ncbi:MAG: hypothetical protein ABR986_09250 [Methanomassiliicoccales archaeon]|jgi:hypothetical protein